MLSGVSPLMKVVTSRGPHLLKPRLCHGRYKVTAAASITGYDVEPRAATASHPATRATGMDRQRCCLSLLIRFYATFFILHFAQANLPARTDSLLRSSRSIPLKIEALPCEADTHGRDCIIKND